LAVEYMKNNSGDFKDFILDNNFERYVSNMGENSTWGGDIELIALSRALNKSIIVLQRNQDPCVFINYFSRPEKEGGGGGGDGKSNSSPNSKNCVVIAYHGIFSHYSAVKIFEKKRV
jgi:hypothetical protein